MIAAAAANFHPYSFLFLLLALVFGLIFFALYIPLFRWQRHDFDRCVGLATTADDRLRLHAWFKHGHVPDSARLRPVLKGYVDYVSRTSKGIVLPGGNTFNYIMIVLAGLTIFFRVLSLVLNEATLRETVPHIVLWLIVGLVWLPSRHPDGNIYFRTLNRRTRQRVARMKRQISKYN